MTRVLAQDLMTDFIDLRLKRVSILCTDGLSNTVPMGKWKNIK